MHSQENVIVVTGGPGGGKTTALDLFQRRYLLSDCGDPWRRREEQQPVSHGGLQHCRGH
jgi:dephospho-CoA kinase